MNANSVANALGKEDISGFMKKSIVLRGHKGANLVASALSK